ncbi:hypothetical protein PGTUg99_030225 [Puccinia graminis f. sp. tritici]|uniref:F-box domain-containing protein n=1 Tax=Puccinia graminis f. sp. tritici TaxID=56615 RepID=A0A5B0N5F2_PUCGR|nr:hypothetical protein PGTUg99_030225 [Puccinia graminis f. sp. tritici]
MEPLQAPRKITLNDLPTEIKLLIIKYLALQSEQNWCHTVDEIATPSLDLAFVNRSFYELCSATNWKVICVRSASRARVQKLIDEILPRQAKHTRSLILELMTGVLELSRSKTAEPIIDIITDRLGRGQLIDILHHCNNLTGHHIQLEPYYDEFGNISNELTNPIPTSVSLLL